MFARLRTTTHIVIKCDKKEIEKEALINRSENNYGTCARLAMSVRVHISLIFV